MQNGGGYADVNGLRMYYEIRGEGPPLVMLHGGTCSIELPHMAPLFAGQFQVIAVEQMGHGRTADCLDREFHYHEMAEDTVELMDQLDLESAFVFGLSDGGVVGFDMAIHHPERVRKLAVTGSNSRGTDVYTESFHEWLLTVKPEDWPLAYREMYERLSPDGPGHWPVVLERLRRMWSSEPDYTLEQMASITAPTLVMAGDTDVVTLEHSVEIFRAIPNSQLCIVPNAGHGVVRSQIVTPFLQEPVNGEH